MGNGFNHTGHVNTRTPKLRDRLGTPTTSLTYSSPVGLGDPISHNWTGKLQSVVASAAMNASFQVWMARSAALTR
jgi:hypothetical protein